MEGDRLDIVKYAQEVSLQEYREPNNIRTYSMQSCKTANV